MAKKRVWQELGQAPERNPVSCVLPLSLSVLLFSLVSVPAPAAELLDLSRAVIVAPEESPVVQTAGRVLVEEIAKRTGIVLDTGAEVPRGLPAVFLYRAGHASESLLAAVDAMKIPEKAEGFAIGVRTGGEAPIVVLAGRDERGVLFAVGKLLLQLRMSKGKIGLPADYAVATAPRYPYRGHQIGFRNLSHCYDAWTPEVYEQYMRELAVFGANAFETTSFRSPNEYDGPHAKVSRGDMAAEWSRICAEYGFDFWLFSSAIGGEGE